MLRASYQSHLLGAALVASPSSIRLSLQQGIRHAGVVVDRETGVPVDGASINLSLGITGPFDLGGEAFNRPTGLRLFGGRPAHQS